jgi:hypothetical protein
MLPRQERMANSWPSARGGLVEGTDSTFLNTHVVHGCLNQIAVRRSFCVLILSEI